MFIDLSVKLNKDTPAYPGDPKIGIAVSETFEKDGCLGHGISMGTHTGTHIDAPAHMIQGGKSFDSFDTGTFVGRVCYIAVKNGVFSIEDVHSADIRQGDIVLFDTGMSQQYYEPVYFENYPAMTAEIAQYLIDRKVKMVGVDTCSIDNDPRFVIHKLLLGSDILIIENLTNLDKLATLEATIYALPLNLALDAAPARVIAQVNE